MPKLDIDNAPLRTGSIYPEPYASQMAGRSSLRLGELAGLTQFGVNIVILEPGAVASLRHWHLREDEFAIVLEGELTLVEDAGETPMRPGDCAAWKAGVANGHRFVNRSDRVARFLVVGTKAPDEVATYTDVDLKVRIGGGKARFTYHDGSDWSGHRDLPKGEKR
ncbi:MAG: cupin domain-containing protein [Defluviimonas sp.]|uniref:cupin domain-containing protein n=1 Tax=Albidovulum sp. TaxID=1872424 RepID=UPI001E1720BD|nr:cupin domain-containing protein [Paracoccaceae bacterium]MCC0063551.1 cupin domain-containing protein [Defluviimonas sp.]